MGVQISYEPLWTSVAPKSLFELMYKPENAYSTRAGYDAVLYLVESMTFEAGMHKV